MYQSHQSKVSKKHPGICYHAVRETYGTDKNKVVFMKLTQNIAKLFECDYLEFVQGEWGWKVDVDKISWQE